MLSRFLSH